jgi:hypothetical protein
MRNFRPIRLYYGHTAIPLYSTELFSGARVDLRKSPPSFDGSANGWYKGDQVPTEDVVVTHLLPTLLLRSR